MVKEFAKQNNCFFRYTSAKNSTGIEDLFRIVGTKFLDPTFTEDGVTGGKGGDGSKRKDTVYLKKKNAEGKKEGCC